MQRGPDDDPDPATWSDTQGANPIQWGMRLERANVSGVELPLSPERGGGMKRDERHFLPSIILCRIVEDEPRCAIARV